MKDMPEWICAEAHEKNPPRHGKMQYRKTEPPLLLQWRTGMTAPDLLFRPPRHIVMSISRGTEMTTPKERIR